MPDPLAPPNPRLPVYEPEGEDAQRVAEALGITVEQAQMAIDHMAENLAELFSDVHFVEIHDREAGMIWRVSESP